MRTAFVMIFVVAASSGCDELFENETVQSPQQSTVTAVPGTDSDPRALTTFADILAPYGYWVDDDVYGVAWTPHDRSFVPYATHGRFANIDGSLVWLSQLPWGGATLHHGRWVRHENHWRWVPGLRYAGAWVTWSHEGGTTSWSPAPPTMVWRDGTAVRIEPPDEPIVGSADDASLALMPSPSPVYKQQPQQPQQPKQQQPVMVED